MLDAVEDRREQFARNDECALRYAILHLDPNLLSQLDNGSVQIITTHYERLTCSLTHGLDNILAVRR